MKRELTFYRVGDGLVCVDLHANLHIIPPYRDNFAGDSAQLKTIRGVAEREASDASQTNEPQ